MFWKALLFFHNVCCWKKKNDTCLIHLNILYDCYALLKTFLNFLEMKKQQKRDEIIHKIISSIISKSSKIFQKILDSSWTDKLMLG